MSKDDELAFALRLLNDARKRLQREVAVTALVRCVVDQTNAGIDEGAIGALLYNAVAARIGGIEVDLDSEA